jgi:hypothetical protein
MLVAGHSRIFVRVGCAVCRRAECRGPGDASVSRSRSDDPSLPVPPAIATGSVRSTGGDLGGRGSGRARASAAALSVPAPCQQGALAGHSVAALAEHELEHEL